MLSAICHNHRTVAPTLCRRRRGLFVCPEHTPGPECHFRTVRRFQLVHDIPYMHLDRALAHRELVRDDLICLSFPYPVENRELALGELRSVGYHTPVRFGRV